MPPYYEGQSEAEYLSTNPGTTKADYNYYKVELPKSIYESRFGKLQQEALKERVGLGVSGAASRVGESFFDPRRGVDVKAEQGKFFVEYGGGGVEVRNIEGGKIPTFAELFSGQKAANPVGASSPGETSTGVGSLNFNPIEGKTIARTGQTVFNPKTGVDEHAGEGETLIQYTDGTVERRKSSDINTPGGSTPIGEFGRTPDELGITEKTGIKNQDGTQQEIIHTGSAQQLAAYKDLEYIGRTYKAANGETRTAKPGNVYYQDPKTRTILERPDKGQEASLQSTSPSVLASRQQTVDPIAEINAFANADQERALSAINSLGNKIDLSDSATLLRARNAADAPVAPSAMQTALDQRAALGVDPLQSKLTQLDNDLRKLDTENISLQKDEEGRRVSMTQIRKRQSALSIDYERVRRDMVAERDALATELNGKMATVALMVQYSQMDYQNANQAYQQKFDNAIKITNLMSNLDQAQKNDAQRAQENARANLTVIMNTIKDGNISYDKLSSSAKNDIKMFEIQAGYPQGFTSFVHKAVPDPVTTIGAPYETVDGKRHVPIVTIGANGVPKVTNITLAGTVTGGGKQSESSINRSMFGDASTFLSRASGQDGYVSPADFRKGRNAFTNDGGSGNDFNSNFVHFVNPANPQDYGFKQDGSDLVSYNK